MCGFCLVVGEGAAATDIRGLTQSIRHRGPDSTKFHVGSRVRCGFNRLAIVDDDARSDQPMVDRSGRYLLVFNGEIYNHNSLRVELLDRHKLVFETKSDTEVLLQGLICEGRAFVARLDGIFAFAFVDLLSLEVMLARDVFGVKPLYYCSRGADFCVSSEVRPLRELTGGALRLDNLARFLAYGAVANGEAIVTGVRELQPNSIAVFQDGRLVSTSSVQSFAYDTRESVTVDEVAEVIDRAIHAQKPEIPYGVLFSGGLDSSLILDRCAGDVRLEGAYSIDVDHPDMSEGRWQDYALGELDLRDKLRRIRLGPEDLAIDRLAAISVGLDYPLFHPNFVGSLLLTRSASENGLKVLLSGEGADELFLGYRWLFGSHPPSEFLEYIPLADIQALLGLAAAPPVSTDGLRLIEVFQKIYLQRWLLRQDLTGMANSVEVRVPFLALDVARLANSLSDCFKRGGGESKWLIKHILSRRFSKEFVERKKVGFDFPLNDWIGRDHFALVRQSGLVDPEVFDEIVRKREGTYMKNRIVFALTSLAVWYEQWSSRSS